MAQELWKNLSTLALGWREVLGLWNIESIVLPPPPSSKSGSSKVSSLTAISRSLIPGPVDYYFMDFLEHILNPEAPTSPLATAYPSCSQPVRMCSRQQFNF